MLAKISQRLTMLLQNDTNSCSACFALNNKRLGEVKKTKDMSIGEGSLKVEECVLGRISPLKSI